MPVHDDLDTHMKTFDEQISSNWYMYIGGLFGV